MGDTLPLNIAPQTIVHTSTSAAPATASVPASIVALPTSLSNLPRPLPLTGTIFEFLPADLTFQMKTLQGLISLKLVGANADMLQRFFDLLDTPTGRSAKIEIQIQAGAPPKEANLLLPKSDAPVQQSPIAQLNQLQPKGEAHNIENPTSLTRANAEGATLKISILPEKIDAASIKQAALQTQQTSGQKTEQSGNTLPKFLERLIGEGHKSEVQAKTSPASTPSTQSSSPAPTAPAAVTTLNTQQTSVSLEAGKTLHAKLNAVLPPQSDWPDTLPPDNVRATVLGKTMTGQTIMDVGGKTAFVHEKVDLPTGTKLLIALQAEGDAPMTLLPLPKDRDFLPMRDIAEALFAISPKGAEAFLHARLPTPAHHFAGTAMFLLSALHGGKLDEWLGPATIHTLTANQKKWLKDKLVDSLKETLDATPRDQTVGEWKSYPIPLHYNNNFEMLRLYVHQDGHQDQSADGKAQHQIKTRFVITMHMSQLGPVQLDGLSQCKKLDLIIRSEKELPERLTTSIRESAISALEAVGLAGTLTFQSDRAHWVTIEDKKVQSSSIEM